MDDVESMAKAIEARLKAGVPIEQVAAEANLEIGTLDGRPAVLLPGWVAVEAYTREAEPVYYPDATSASDAAKRYVYGDCEYDPRERTYWVHVRCHRVAVGMSPNGYPIHAIPDGVDMDVVCTIDIHPEEPECSSGQGHEWEYVDQWGDDYPVYAEACAHCGLERITDTGAQDTSTGEQRLTSIEYR